MDDHVEDPTPAIPEPKPEKGIGYAYKKENVIYFPDEDIDFSSATHMPENMIEFIELTNKDTGRVRRVATKVPIQMAAIEEGVVREDLPARIIQLENFIVPGDTVREVMANFQEAKDKAVAELIELMKEEFDKQQKEAIKLLNLAEGKSEGGILIPGRHGRQPNNPQQLKKGKRKKGKRLL